MKRKLILVILMLVSIGLICSCNQDNSSSDTGKLKVYSSFYPMWDFTSKIGGDKIDSKLLVPMGTEAHDWEPSTTDIADLEKADVLVINGAGMEGWADSIIASLSNKDLLVIEASDGIDLMEGHHHHHDEDEAAPCCGLHHDEDEEHEDEEHEHDHEDADHKHEDAEHEHNHEHEDADHEHEHHHNGGLDPHIWTSPSLAKKEMENIMKGLCEKDPDNADYYKANFDKYSKEFDDLDNEFKTEIEKLPRRDIVVSHEAFGYLSRDYALNQIGIEGLIPESEPTPQKMAEIIDFVNENDVKVIFFENTSGSKVADSIGKATGAKPMVLNTLESLTKDEVDSGDDYFSVMRKNLEAIKEALK